MSAETFVVEYDGPALEGGLMDVNELAPALLALGALCKEANEVVNGSAARVSLEVRSDFKRGSFDVSLNLVVNYLEQVRSLLLGQPKDAKELLEVIGFYAAGSVAVVKGLLSLRRRLNGRRVESSTALGDGTTKLVLEDASIIIVDAKTAALFARAGASRAMDTVAKPLLRDGITVFRVRLRGDVQSEIQKQDLPAMSYRSDEIADQPMLSDSTVEKVYEIITGSKSMDYIWRLFDGESNINARISDEDFFHNILAGNIVIALGDYLRVAIHSVTFEEQGRLKTIHTVVRVIEHIRRPGTALDQTRFIFDSDDTRLEEQ